MKTVEELNGNYHFKNGYIQGYNGQPFSCRWALYDQEGSDHKKGWRQGVADAYNDGVERTEKWIEDCLEEGKCLMMKSIH